MTRDLRIIDCTRDSSLSELQWFLSLPIDKIGSDVQPVPRPEELEEIVWGEVNGSFSTPVQKGEDPIEYVPTQIVAELFKEGGADGIAYKSSICKGGHNVALFDLDAAELVSGELYTVEAVDYTFKQAGNP